MQNTRSLVTLRSMYPMLILSVCACYVFYKLLLQTYPSVITHELMSEFRLSATGLGNLAATFYYTYMITQLFVGVLLDKYSVRWLTGTAMLVCALGVLLFSQAHTIWAAQLSRALMGVGVAFATVSYMKLAALWLHPRQYAFANGLLASAAMVGATCGQAPLSWLTHDYGWRQSLFGISILGFILAGLFIFSVSDAAPFAEQEEKNQIRFKDILQIFKNKQNWLLTIYGGFAFCPFAVFGGLWGNPFLQQAYNLTKIQAASFMSLIFIGFGLGSPLLGILSDRLKNRKQVMIMSTLLSCVAISLVLYCALPVWLLQVLLFLFGFGLGAYMLAFTIGKEINPLFITASVMAMINASDAFLDALTEPAIGKLLDLSWHGEMVNGIHYFPLSAYHLALAVLPVYLLLAVMILGWIKER